MRVLLRLKSHSHLAGFLASPRFVRGEPWRCDGNEMYFRLANDGPVPHRRAGHMPGRAASNHNREANVKRHPSSEKEAKSTHGRVPTQPCKQNTE